MEHNLRRYAIEELSHRLEDELKSIESSIESLARNIDANDKLTSDLKKHLHVYRIQKDVISKQIVWLDQESDATPNEIEKFSEIK